MKALLIAVGATVMIAFVSFGGKTTYERVAPEPQVIEKEIIKDNTAERIKKAQDDAMERINTEAEKMRNEFVQNELKEIESSVLKEITAELEARRVQLDKETGAF
jgi:uncharacterized membrane protein YhiD involved in acid resistance